jgi:hypothetical protein
MLTFGDATSWDKREVMEVLDTIRAGSVPDLRRYYASSPAGMPARLVEDEDPQENSTSELIRDPKSAPNNAAPAAAAPSASIDASGPNPNKGLPLDHEAQMRNILAKNYLLDYVPKAPTVHFRFNVVGLLADLDTQSQPIEYYSCISEMEVVSSVAENLNRLKGTATQALTARFPIRFATIGERSKPVFYVVAKLPGPNQVYRVIDKDTNLKVWVRDLAKNHEGGSTVSGTSRGSLTIYAGLRNHRNKFQPVVEKEHGVSFPYDAEAVKTRKAAKGSKGVKNEDSSDVPTGTKRAPNVKELPSGPAQWVMYKCRFRHCRFKSPNSIILRRHIILEHVPDAKTVEQESDPYQCWWKGCVEYPEDRKASFLVFESMGEWMDHIDEEHLDPMAAKLAKKGSSGVTESPVVPQTQTEDGPDAGTGTKQASDVKEPSSTHQSSKKDGLDAGTGTQHDAGIKGPPSAPQTQKAMFKCRFPLCDREAHNLKTLRGHISRRHVEPPRQVEDESKPYECWWKDCVVFAKDGTASPQFTFATMDEWMEHFDKTHLNKMAAKLAKTGSGM